MGLYNCIELLKLNIKIITPKKERCHQNYHFKNERIEVMEKDIGVGTSEVNINHVFTNNYFYTKGKAN